MINLDLVIGSLTSRLRFFNFVQISNRIFLSLYRQINDLPSTTCVQILNRAEILNSNLCSTIYFHFNLKSYVLGLTY